MARVPDFDARERAFYLAYGEAMAHWAELEHYLGNLFIILTGLAPDLGRSIFYSARSFLGRADMVTACIPFAKTLPQGMAFLDGVVKRARQYVPARNALAHDRHEIWSDWGEGGDTVRRQIKPLSGDAIAIGDLANAAFNFHYLAEILKVSIGRKKLVPEPELSLALLALLPVDPLASVEYRTKAEPLRSELERLQR
jgi:hypothetical protein